MKFLMEKLESIDIDWVDFWFALTFSGGVFKWTDGTGKFLRFKVLLIFLFRY